MDRMIERLFNGLGALVVLLLVVLLIVGIPLVVEQERVARERWARFVVEQNCRIVERKEGHTSIDPGFGVTASGKSAMIMTKTTTPAQVAYLCDDGVTYWRNAQ